MKNVGKIVVFALLIAMLSVTAQAAPCEIGDVTLPNGAEFLRGNTTVTWTWLNATDCAAAVAQVSWRINDAGPYTVIGNAIPGGTTLPWNTATAGGDSSLYRLLVSIASDSDESNNFFTIDNTVPVAEANGAYACTEAGNTAVDSTGSSDATSGIANITWDFNNDGVYETPGAAPTYNCAQEGAYTINVQVADNSGNTANDTATVNVANAPPVVNVLSPNGGEYLRGNVPISWSAVDVYDNLTITVEYSTDNGTTNNTIVAGVPNNGSITWDTSAINALNVTVNVIANDGTVSVLDASNGLFAIDNTAPIAVDGGDVTINEDGNTMLNAAGSSDPFGEAVLLSYAWDFDGDGFDDAFGVNPVFTPNASILSTYDGVYNLSLQATDGAGNTATDTMTVTVNNVAPTVTVNFPNGGESLTGNVVITWTASDVIDTLLVDLSYTVDGLAWNMIATDVANNGSYTWNTAGLQSNLTQVLVDVADGTVNLSDASNAVFSLDSVLPVAEANGGYACNEAAGALLSSAGSDGSTSGILSTDWDLNNDGTFEYNETTLGAPTFSCVDDGNFLVQVRITDNVGQQNNDTSNVVVSNELPVTDAGLDFAATEGQLVTLNATYTDLGANDTHNATVDWGDGTPVQSLGAVVGGAFSATHTYADDDADDLYTVTVTVTDDDGGFDSDTADLTITNVAPAVNAGSDQTISEGQTLTVTPTWTDMGSADTHSVIIDWNDGSSTNYGVQTSGFNATHNYDNDVDPSSYTVTVTVTDDDSAATPDTLQATVLNVLPAVQITFPTGGENLSGTVSITWTASDPAVNDTPVSIEVLYSPDNGGSWTSIANDTLNTGSANWDTTTVADGNQYLIQIVASDDDGSNTSTSALFTVDNTAATSSGPEASPSPVVSGNNLTLTGTVSDAFTVTGASAVVLLNNATIGNYTMTAVDGAFDESSEDVVVTVDTTGFAAGTYVFYLSARDAALSWQVQTPENTDTFVVISSDPYYTKLEVDTLVAGNLSLYYNITEIDSILTGYYTKVDVYNKTEVDSLIAGFLANYYNKTQIDAMFANYYNTTQIDALFANYYSMAQVNAILLGNLSNYYNSTEIDNILLNYYTVADVYNKTEVDTLLTNLAANYYTIAQIDAMFANYYTQGQIDAMFANVYTIAQVDALIASELSAYYTSVEVDNILTNYYTVTEVYTKAEVDALIAGLSGTYYTMAQVDALFANYYTQGQVDAMFDFRIIASSPSGVVTTGAQTLAVDTSQTATCKYSTTAFNFNTQGTALSGAGTTSHSGSLGTLADGTYTYYVQCRDATTNVLTSYFPVTFNVDTAGNFNYVQDLNLNWNALFLPNPTIIFGPSGSGYWGYAAGTLKQVFDNSGIAGSYSIVWYFDTTTNTWKSYTDDGNGLNDDLTTVNNRNDQPYWTRMTVADRFEAATVVP